MPDTLGRHRVIRRALQLVGHAHGVEHAPQHIQLELQDVQHAFLRITGAVVLQGNAQAMLDVAARLAQTIAEVVVTGRIDPRVVLRPGVQARLVDGRRGGRS